jgi:hypothetical protein
MTTITWDGTILAADSRGAINGTDLVSDNRFKIRTLKQPMYLANIERDAPEADKKVLITHIAGAGAGGAIKAAIEAMEAAPLSFLDFHRKLKSSTLQDPRRSFTLLLIAEGRAFTFRAGESHFRESRTSLERDLPLRVSIGSGSDVAQWLMRSFDVPPHLAVAGASLTDPHTGGVIHVRKFKKGAVVREEEIYYGDMNKLRRELQRWIAKHPVAKEVQLASQYHHKREDRDSRLFRFWFEKPTPKTDDKPTETKA